MALHYFEDFKPGDRFDSAGVTITEAQIIEFALRYDPQPFHLDVEAAKQSMFGGLVASGLMTLALGLRLFLQTGIMGANLGSPGLDEVRFLKPVRPGDTIRMQAEVLETRPSGSKPDRGTVRIAYHIFNQRGEEALSLACIHIVRRRSA
jgi:acyl dehydratase